MRKYKEATPLQTVTHIRKILMDTGIVPYESEWFDSLTELHSVRVMTFPQDGCCGQNGKGRSQEFALASAYAEFMERLQNNIITRSYSDELLPAEFLPDIKKKTGFYYFPDEKIIQPEEIFSLPEDYLLDAFGTADITIIRPKIEAYISHLHAKGLPGILGVPFYNYQEKNILYLPFNFTISFLGSNGMCAGNTSYEALFQGLCELLERYAAASVFHQRLTPPTIPDAVLAQYPKEYKLIKAIRKQNYEVIIKDFSCGIQLPVVGTLLIHKEKKIYKLNVGAETSFPYALSRTLTETFQGMTLQSFEALSLPLPEEEYPFFLSDDVESIRTRNREFEKFCGNNLGRFPYALFDKGASYASDLDSTFGVKDSYKEEVAYLISKIQGLGSELYFRNVSFLGFPSFLIYATHMSNLGKKNVGDGLLYERMKKNKDLKELCEEITFPLQTFWKDKKRIRLLIEKIDPMHLVDIHQPMHTLFSLHITDSQWSVLPLSFFVSIFYYVLEEYAQAIRYLRLFMKHNHAEQNKYYQEVIIYYSLLQQRAEKEEIKSIIHPQVIKDFAVENLFSILKVPLCPACDACLLKEKCLTHGKINLHIKTLLKSDPQNSQLDIFE